MTKFKKSLRFATTIMTIKGEVLHESKYKANGVPIKFIDHNEHAWTPAITIFPRDGTVKYIPAEFSPEFSIEAKLSDFIYQLSKNDPAHEMTHVAINGRLPDFDLTGFARVVSIEIAEGLLPGCYISIGKHMAEKHRLTIVLLRYMIDCRMLVSLIVNEAIISYQNQTEVWLPQPDSLDSIISEIRKQFPDLNEKDIIRWSKQIFEVKNTEANNNLVEE